MIEMIIIFSLLTLLNAFWDFWLISDQIEINHAKSTFVWIVVYLMISAFVSWATGHPREDIIFIILIWWPVRWIFHDIVLNLLRGKPWDYLDPERVASRSDKFLRRLPFPHIFFKIASLLIWWGLMRGAMGFVF